MSGIRSDFSEQYLMTRVIDAQEIAAARTQDPFANPEKQDFDMVDTIQKTGLYKKVLTSNLS